ncbi:collagen alpha-2(I) chain-like [Crotalus tigris]|uniref:collagen alpha-2(I) chain-like n=1 Tax=Crotalus tigris TaxID=88082 RepID=UPI00192F1CDC|nr:collagen alpha-2(I) chain-like [Crotalus tigris]
MAWDRSPPLNLPPGIPTPDESGGRAPYRHRLLPARKSPPQCGGSAVLGRRLVGLRGEPAGPARLPIWAKGKNGGCGKPRAATRKGGLGEAAPLPVAFPRPPPNGAAGGAQKGGTDPLLCCGAPAGTAGRQGAASPHQRRRGAPGHLRGWGGGESGRWAGLGRGGCGSPSATAGPARLAGQAPKGGSWAPKDPGPTAVRDRPAGRRALLPAAASDGPAAFTLESGFSLPSKPPPRLFPRSGGRGASAEGRAFSHPPPGQVFWKAKHAARPHLSLRKPERLPLLVTPITELDTARFGGSLRVFRLAIDAKLLPGAFNHSIKTDGPCCLLSCPLRPLGSSSPVLPWK